MLGLYNRVYALPCKIRTLTRDYTLLRKPKESIARDIIYGELLSTRREIVILSLYIHYRIEIRRESITGTDGLYYNQFCDDLLIFQRRI